MSHTFNGMCNEIFSHNDEFLILETCKQDVIMCLECQKLRSCLANHSATNLNDCDSNAEFMQKSHIG